MASINLQSRFNAPLPKVVSTQDKGDLVSADTVSSAEVILHSVNPTSSSEKKRGHTGRDCVHNARRTSDIGEPLKVGKARRCLSWGIYRKGGPGL